MRAKNKFKKKKKKKKKTNSITAKRIAKEKEKENECRIAQNVNHISHNTSSFTELLTGATANHSPTGLAH